MNDDDKITVEWSIYDILETAPQLTQWEARQVIFHLKQNFHKTKGISQETIDEALELLYPDYFGI